MKQDLPFVLQRNVLPSEGGYCWDRGDPGGPTKYGITCYDLAQHRGQRMHSMSAWAPIVRAMTLDEAMDIYNTKYAVKCRFNELPSGLDYTIIDYAINSGLARPPLVLSRLLGLPSTHTMTDTIMARIQKVDTEKLIHSVNAERLHFMHQIRGGSSWRLFGKGWQRRVDHVDTTSIQMYEHPLPIPQAQVTGQPINVPLPTPRPVVPADHPLAHVVAPPKQEGSPSKVIHAPNPTVQKAIKHGTGWTSGMSQTFQFLDEHRVAILVGGVIIAVIGVGVYLAYRHYHNRKNFQVELPPGITPLLPKSAAA